MRKMACIKLIIVWSLLAFHAVITPAIAQQKLPIGVFDSGTGGLTVLQAMLTLDAYNNTTGAPGPDGKPDFSNETFQYLADQANMPYGNYAAENKTALLKEHILKNMHFLLQQQYALAQQSGWAHQKKPAVKMIVVACNTATAYALSDIQTYVQQQQHPVPVIGVIDAGTKAALQYQQSASNGTIGVFATAGTVASDGYPRTLRTLAAKMNLPEPSIVSQGGVGLAESIDRDWSYFSDTLTTVRSAYKGPSVKNKNLYIDTTLTDAYRFNADGNKLLCETDGSGSCLDMQLNDPANYVRYHLVTLCEKMLQQQYAKPMNTLILGCTHYPYLTDTIAVVLQELYNFQRNGEYRYRKVLAPHVELIDPSVETAKEAYAAMRKSSLQYTGRNNNKHMFFISVPNTTLAGVQLQDDGWFTYAYKYGRSEGANTTYVQYVPFNTKNISAATYSRFKTALPDVYKKLQLTVKGIE